MIEAPSEVKQVNNFDTSEAIDVRLSDSDQARKVLLDLLINKTYTDKPWAIVREYGTNAMDANIAAGRGDLPIEIKAPTPYSGEFYIRDFGDGLDPNEIKEVFVALGESTKRYSNDQTGMMGIGAKAGFCYSDFRIQSIKDGLCYKYLATKNDKGLPTFIPIGAPTKTKEHSGLTVAFDIKSSDIPSIRNRIKFLATFAKVKPTIIDPDNNLVAAKQGVCLLEGDDWKVFDDENPYLSELNIVMGNICYNCRHHELLKEISFIKNDYKLVIYAKMGEISFTSSREEVEYTERTMQNIRKHIATLCIKLQQEIDKHIVESKNIFQAINKYSKFNSFFDTKGFTWNGVKYTSATNQFKNIVARKLYKRGRRIYDYSYDILKDDKGVEVDTPTPYDIARVLIDGTAKIVTNLNLAESRRNRWRFNTLTTQGIDTVIEIISMPPEYGTIDVDFDWQKVEFTKPPASSKRVYSDVYEYDSATMTWEIIEPEEIPDGEKHFALLEANKGVAAYYSVESNMFIDFVDKTKKPLYGIRRTKYKNVVNDTNKKDWVFYTTLLKTYYKYEVKGTADHQLAYNTYLYSLVKQIKAEKLLKLLTEVHNFNAKTPNDIPPSYLYVFNEAAICVNRLHGDIKPDAVLTPPSVNKEITALFRAYPWLNFVADYKWGWEEVVKCILDINKNFSIKVPEIY